LVFGGLLGFLGANLAPSGQADPSTPATSSAPIPKELTSYRDVVKKVLPAVVSIRVVSAAKAKAVKTDQADPADEFPFDSDLRRFMEEMRRRGEMNPSPIGQFGSGVVVDPSGIVVTNNHVVAGAEQVEVTFKDGTRMLSKSVFADPRTDLAVVKLNGSKPLPYAELGNSEEMEIGDRVLAVGAPFGLAGSVTHGIISAKGRSLNMSFFEDYLQTDAPINPGNSGGPLVNLAGQVVGINTAIKSQTGGFQGVGMAIPSTKDGVVRRGYLGVQMQDITPEVAEKLKLDSARGVVVAAVQPNGPAAKGGIKDGDIVVGVAGQPIEDGKRLQRIVRTAPLGKPLPFDVIRDGKKETVQVTIEQMPDDYGLVSIESPRRRPRLDTEAIPLNKLGLEVADLTPELAEQLGVDKGKGAVITAVENGSLAHMAGLRRGMLITSAERKPVESANALKDIVSKGSLEEGILLRVKTPQGTTRYVILKAES
jgi:serine protease Do